MEEKNMMKRWLSGVIAAALVFSLLYAVKADADQTSENRKVIASLDYEYTGAEDVEPDQECDLNASKYGDKATGYKFTSGDAKLFASVTGDKNKTLEWAEDDVVNEEGVKEKQIIPVYDMDGTEEYAPVMSASKKNPWPTENTGVMPYFEMQFSTKGMKQIEVSAYVGATKKGPRDYRMTYAVGDEVTYTVLSDKTAVITLNKNKKLQKISGLLPENAADQKLVKVRIEIASLLRVDQSEATTEVPVTLTPDSGEAAINHISITGVENTGVSPTATPTPSPTPTATSEPPASPTITPGPSNTNAPSSSKKKAIVVKKLKLNRKKLTLKKGKKYTLKLTIVSTAKKAKDKKALKKAVKWSSSKKKVAVVSKKGKVKAKKKGKTTITAKLKGKKISCKVTVK